MRLEKHFEVDAKRDDAVAVTACEEALVTLFPDARAEVVARDGDRVTLRTHYNALGREGVATFHFTFLMDGDVAFEKVCDGNVWKRLRGVVRFAEARRGTRVTLELDGATRGLIPEFAIRGPMQEQIEQMAAALRRRIQQGRA